MTQFSKAIGTLRVGAVARWGQVRSVLSRAPSNIRSGLTSWWRAVTPMAALVMAPGVLLALAGAVLLLAPAYAVPFFALFLLVAGAAFSLAAWQLVLLKRRAEGLLHQVELRVTIQGVRPPLDPTDAALLEQKKVVFH